MPRITCSDHWRFYLCCKPNQGTMSHRRVEHDIVKVILAHTENSYPTPTSDHDIYMGYIIQIQLANESAETLGEFPFAVARNSELDVVFLNFLHILRHAIGRVERVCTNGSHSELRGQRPRISVCRTSGHCQWDDTFGWQFGIHTRESWPRKHLVPKHG